MEAKRVCETDPHLQGWYVNIHSSQYIKSCAAGWREGWVGGEGRRGGAAAAEGFERGEEGWVGLRLFVRIG